MLLVGFIINILCIIGCVKIAQSKNRDAAVWGILAFFFGLIPLIIIAIIEPLGNNNNNKNNYY